MTNNEFQFFRHEWEQFKRFEEAQHDKLDKDIAAIHTKLDSINEDRWKIKGVLGVIGVFSGSVGAILAKHLFG